ncbi:MAG TPA: LemA family protein [Lacunisphaera sp.]|nr:LemA family protein [Lacunisphaera sp.]
MNAVHDPASVPFWLPLAGGLLALGFLWGAMRAARKRRLIDGLPTCKTTGVFIGLVEVQGTAEATAPLASHLAGAACVHYAWSVEEKWSRTVTETTTDSKGNKQITTRHESGWTTVADGGEQSPFYVRDDCGVLLVRPDGAKIEPVTIFERTCGRDDPLYYGKGPATAVANSDHERKFHEVAIPLHAPVYVMGRAREREDIVAAEIAAGPDTPLFLISTRSEKKISRGYAITFWVLLVLALGIGGAAAGFGLAMIWPERGPGWVPFALGGVAGALVAIVAWTWMVFNSLVDLRNRVASAWSQVDVQLKRRFDLIPRIEGVVQGLQQHERTTQETLATLRAQRDATPPGVAGPDFQAVGGRLTAVIERYPDLKADAGFLKLHQELVDTEQRIALARGYYNEIATHYNTTIEVVPERFVAGLTRLQPRPLLAAGDFERAPVTVKLVG